MTRGGITAMEPMVVPTSSRVKPSTHTSRIRKGTERNRFTITLSTRFRPGRGLMPSWPVITNRTPKGSPKT